MNTLILQVKRVTPLCLTVFALACFVFSTQTRAACNSPDPGCPGGNLAEGLLALGSLITGDYNTAVGYLSLTSNTVNPFNTAVGAGALFANNDPSTNGGNSNTATGAAALFSNTTGFSNTASGAFALLSNSTGVLNDAVGDSALHNNTIGTTNTAIGAEALDNNVSGSGNTAVGAFAGSGVIAANDVICIGNTGADVSSSTWISNIYQTATVSGTTLPVIVSDQGQLGTTPSSRRFKKEIKPMDDVSEAILALKPVTFRYKSDAKGITQFGLVAEDVAEVNPDLVVRDKEGKPYSVRYDQVNAMLLNEFLKEHRKNEEQEATIAHQQKQIDALTTGLQKVNAQLEANKPTPQVVTNNH
jgi:hypothetical protein